MTARPMATPISTLMISALMGEILTLRSQVGRLLTPRHGSLDEAE